MVYLELRKISISNAFRSTIRNLNQEVYAYVTKFFIQRYGDLTFAEMASAGYHNYERELHHGPYKLPSWVPGFRSTAGTRNVRFSRGAAIVQHGNLRPYNATGLSQAHIGPESILQLSLQGVHVSRIVRTTENHGSLE